jgi:hypothetical protein
MRRGGEKIGFSGILSISYNKAGSISKITLTNVFAMYTRAQKQQGINTVGQPDKKRKTAFRGVTVISRESVTGRSMRCVYMRPSVQPTAP